MNPTDDNQSDLWRARPSQVLNFPWYAIAVVMCVVLVWLDQWLLLLPALLIPLWAWLEIRMQSYRLTSDGRFLWTHGVLNRQTEFIELYRIKDFLFTAPLHLRPMGLANVTLLTSDPSTGGRIHLRAIPKAEETVALLRPLVEKARSDKGVREIDGGMDF